MTGGSLILGNLHMARVIAVISNKSPHRNGLYNPMEITSYDYITGWWFGTCFIFYNIWDVILPIDFHIFQRGRYTTNQITHGHNDSGTHPGNSCFLFTLWNFTVFLHQFARSITQNVLEDTIDMICTYSPVI